MRSYIIKRIEPVCCLKCNQSTHEYIISDHVFTWFQMSESWKKIQINTHESAVQNNRCTHAFTVWNWHALLINQNSLCYILIYIYLHTTRFKMCFFPLVPKCHKDREKLCDLKQKSFLSVPFSFIHCIIWKLTHFLQVPKMYG